MSFVNEFSTAHIGRRRLLAGAAALMAASSMGIRVSAAPAAQDAAPAVAMPEHAAGWPKFNLNKASEEQLLAIPGSGEKMMDEMHEYAPYDTIAEFRGELGKYIDADAVAGLEAYLFVPVDPNASDADTLRQLPGVTAEVADKIVAARPFADAAAFQAALEGMISPELAKLAPQFIGADAPAVAWWPKYDLDSATDEQLLAIPGSGEKMLDEFREYAPYDTIAEFRGEIGKYIDPAALAQLESYIYVPVKANDADADTLRQLPGVTEEIAGKIAAARPYADNAAFQTALEALVGADLAAAAAAYLGA